MILYYPTVVLFLEFSFILVTSKWFTISCINYYVTCCLCSCISLHVSLRYVFIRTLLSAINKMDNWIIGFTVGAWLTYLLAMTL